MKPAILIGIALLPAVALAHPADDPCKPGLHTEDGCQPVIKSLMLDQPDFYKAHRAYWHCRRELVAEDLMALGMCVGANKRLSETLGKTYEETVSEEALCSYWKLIPAHPELDELDSEDLDKNINRAYAQLGACELTRYAASVVIYLCEQKRAQLQSAVSDMVSKYSDCKRRKRCK